MIVKSLKREVVSSVEWSDEEPASPNILVHGQSKVGKSTLALSLAKKFPSTGLPTVRATGPARLIFDDLVWLSFDDDATAAFSERGIKVREFNVRKFMSDQRRWKAASFPAAPNVIGAVEYGLRELAKIVGAGVVDWIVVDTISAYDKMLDRYTAVNGPKRSSDEATSIAAKGLMFQFHKMLMDNLLNMGPGLCILCHSKANIDFGLGGSDQADKNKKVRSTYSIPGVADIVPDITGKSQSIYKGDCKLQLALRAIPGPKIGNKPTLRRELLTRSMDSQEAGTAWDLSLEPIEEAHLGKILAKIRK